MGSSVLLTYNPILSARKFSRHFLLQYRAAGGKDFVRDFKILVILSYPMILHRELKNLLVRTRF